jgi:hypothetical protein
MVMSGRKIKKERNIREIARVAGIIHLGSVLTLLVLKLPSSASGAAIG